MCRGGGRGSTRACVRLLVGDPTFLCMRAHTVSLLLHPFSVASARTGSSHELQHMPLCYLVHRLRLLMAPRWARLGPSSAWCVRAGRCLWMVFASKRGVCKCLLSSLLASVPAGALCAPTALTSRSAIGGTQRRKLPPTKEFPKGRVTTYETPVHVSSVQLVDPTDG